MTTATTSGIIILPLRIRASSSCSAHNHHHIVKRRNYPSPPSTTATTTAAAAPNHNNNWWTPLFGWSSDPDYIDDSDDNGNGGGVGVNNEDSKTAMKAEKRGTDRVRSGRYAPGCFTEEKARRMRIMMLDVQEAHHDVMYHSAIASRLASDFSDHR